MASLQAIFSEGPFIPHGHCYLWKSSLVWLHVASDALIALAYYSIALALLHFVQKRKDTPFRGLFWLFAAFIGACGTTHLFDIWTLWFPTYWISGGVKALTALISLYTAVALIPRIPAALAMPSPLQLEALNQSLAQEIADREIAEKALQQLNQDLEQRIEVRTQALAQSRADNEGLLQQEQAARTQLEAALENLQSTTERLNIALSAAQMGTWEWDLNQDSLYWSPKTEEILGYAPGASSPSYSAWAQRVYSEDLPRVEAALTQAQQTQEIFSEEYRILWPAQRLFWVLSQGRCIFSPEGSPRKMIGIVQEITAAKQAELSLLASESRFRAVFEQAAVGMARLSVEGRWLQVNQTLCDLLGFTPQELIGQAFQEITYPADLAQDDHYYQQLIQKKISACGFEKRYLHKDGKPIWTMVTVSTERTEANGVAAFIAVIEDIRQLKQVRTELQTRADELAQANEVLAITTAVLQKRNQELDQFAYAASHDLKAPLRAIANLSEWIEEDLGSQLPEENQHQLALLRSRAHRMERLINGLLAYSRAGRQGSPVEDVAVDQLLANVIDSLSPPSAFTIDVPANMPTLKTNRVALSRVFSNLIDNAIKHHDLNHGHIQVTVYDQRDWLEFAVIDDGPGIDPQYHKKIFDIFQTLKARDEFESTGIGLSVVKKIVEAEGGAIYLDSTSGRGATFRFTWPQRKTP